MDKETNAWEKPQLIILARGNPEESVLTNCKTNNPNKALDGPMRQDIQQCSFRDAEGNCQNCQDRGIGADT